VAVTGTGTGVCAPFVREKELVANELCGVSPFRDLDFLSSESGEECEFVASDGVDGLVGDDC
jgi:hypothetical protein